MDNIRSLAGCIISAVFAYFTPVESIFLGVAWVFLVNFIFGLLNGIVVKSEPFSFRKAFSCIVEAMVLYVLMATIFLVGDRIGNQPGAMQCITAVVYALIYFYTVNILRNIKGLFPGNRLIRFLYWILSIEFVKEIPFVGDYLAKFNRHEHDEEEHHEHHKSV